MKSNFGGEWTAEEKKALEESFEAGKTIEELVEAHGRTANAIVSQLMAQKRLVLVGREYHRLGPCYASFESLREIQDRIKPAIEAHRLQKIELDKRQMRAAIESSANK